MEYGSIKREIRVEASPEVVFEVISRPEHIREWWPDDAEFGSTPGGSGELSWGEKGTAGTTVVPITVVDLEPPRLFSFRWAYSQGEVPASSNSLLVTIELVPSGKSTVVRLTETGFRERGWAVAVLEEQYKEHSDGWDFYLPRLGDYITQLVSRS